MNLASILTSSNSPLSLIPVMVSKYSKRLNFYETQFWEEKCNYCNGKRIVKRRTLVEDIEVDDLKIDIDKHIY